MSRVPRFVLAAVLTVGGGLGLAACRSEPTVAAYISGDRITEAQIDEIVDDAARTIPEGGAVPARVDVLTTLLMGRVCADLQAKQGFPSGQVTVEQVAQVDRVSKDSRYAAERAKTYRCLTGIPKAEAVTPTDAELRDIYQRAAAKGLVETPYNEIKDRLAADRSVQESVAVNRVLTERVAAGQITVNPRYRPMEFTISDLGSGQPLVVLALGEPASDAVQDVQ
ncbi:MAG TPA: hypothetical protein VF163_15330 [Micromonosporaceae bacterium]